MTFEDVKLETRDQTSWIILARPEAMNAVRPRTYVELAEAFEQADADRDTRFIVLTGEGRGFCAGDDFNEIFLSEKNHPSKRSDGMLARYRSSLGAATPIVDRTGALLSVLRNMRSYIRAFATMPDAEVDALLTAAERGVADHTYMACLPQFLVTGTRT